MAPVGFPDRLPALTSVRILLALGVVLFHYHFMWPWDDLAHTGLIERARLGVDVFFILSGFVLTHAYRDRIAAGQLSYGEFLLARAARIYPAHLAVLAFVLVMVAGASLVGAEFDGELYNAEGFAATLLLVHAWFPPGLVAEWNGPSWSLSAEWAAYLAFPIFAWLGLKLQRRPLALIAVAALAFLLLDALYRALFGAVLPRAEAVLGVLRIAPEFLYGIGLYRLGERLAPSPRAARSAALAAAVTFLACMHWQADDRVIVVVAGPLVLSLALLSKTRQDGWAASPWLMTAGEASYALYLVHFPLLIAWKGAVSALSGKPSDYVLSWHEVGGLLVLSLTAALLLHRWIEAPARRFIRQLSRRGGGGERVKPPAGLTAAAPR
jgi:peptidoglycan/LPS O-acetylase OafA/YrhL